jgi:galactokinase
MSLDRAEQCKRDFAEEYGTDPEAIVRAPGRVNLIGEHTDYHEGFVLPAAIQPAITLAGRRRDDRLLRVHSRTLGASFALPLDAEARPPERWAHYFQGVLRVLPVEYPLPGGADVLVEADLSYGGGLASSSALVVGFSALLARLYELPLDARALALLGCDAEHWYGTTGGIMDHFVISHARAGHALLLDCRSLDHRQVPLPPDVAIVVADTRTRHDQLNSPFAQRRRCSRRATRRSGQCAMSMGRCWARRAMTCWQLTRPACSGGAAGTSSPRVRGRRRRPWPWRQETSTRWGD